MTHTHTHTRRLAVFIAIGVAISGLAAATGLFTLHAAKFNQDENHRIYVRDPSLLAEITARGGHVIADYGSYQVIEVDPALARSLNGREGVEWRDEDSQVLLNAGAVNVKQESAKRLRGVKTAARRLHLVQFVGPIKPEWLDELTATGVEIVNYVPNNAYLVYGDDEALNNLQFWMSQSRFVQWESEYQAKFKIAPSVTAGSATPNAPQNADSSAPGEGLFAIQLFADQAVNQVTMDLVNSLQLAPIKTRFRVGNFVNIVVALSLDAVAQIAERKDVVSITRYSTPRRFDERQCQIVAGNLSGSLPAPGDYLNFLASQGFTQAQFNASGFAINISDSGVDNGSLFPTHFGLYTGGNRAAASRLIYNRLVGTPNDPNSSTKDCDGHGTINAHIIAGYVPSGPPFDTFPHADANGFRYGMGIAPFVRIGSSVIFDGSASVFSGYTYPDFIELESRAYQDGSRISSNGWGAAGVGEYNFDAQAYDYLVRDSQPSGAKFEAPGNQQNVIIFSAGNDGPTTQTVGMPGSAKNVITVGASESVRFFGGTDKCDYADFEADNANDMTSFSSRGPTQDGRKKPDLVAPGTHITGGVFQTANPPQNGQADPCFDGSGVCGGPSFQKFFPVSQQFYTASTGTSHATPAIAGAAALIRQRFINEGLLPPSPAMTNSARYLTGADANDARWSKAQGMGAVNLRSAFGLFTTTTLLRDQEATDMFTASGQTRIYNGAISDSSKPLRVTLAWTDAPGSTTGAAYVNNLDLEVTIGGQVYKGNVFNGAFSATGGSFDSRNNLESVFIPAGLSGAFTVRVIATNIAGDGVPNNLTRLDQDFALIVFNMAEGLQPLIDAVGGSLANETCSPANGAIDPGELVTVNLSLQNTGRSATSNLIATLQATGGVSAPSAPQNYGSLAPRGAAVTMPFSFRAGGACGGTLTATLQLQDGATNLGAVSFKFNLGSTKIVTNTFTNGAFISLPSSGAAAVYPSTINVTGLAGSINKVTVKLTNVNHTYPDDLDILLVAPGGQKILLMSDCGGGGDLINANLTFDDAAATLPNTMTITTGAYGPANYGIADNLPSPAPPGPHPDPQRLSAFNGLNPNGAWKLFVFDDYAGNSGNIANGWSLTIATNVPECCIPAPCLMTIGPQTIPSGYISSQYNQTFTHTGGVAPVSFSLTGALPAGISFNNGQLSGAPAQSGNFPITVTATDSAGCTATANYTLAISGVPSGGCIATVPSNNWSGEYFNNRTLSGGPVMVRNDGSGAINFDWGGDSPGSACGVGVDNFSARWTRTVNFAAGTYRFTVTGDDGIRLYVDGQLMLDKWLDQWPTTYIVDVALSAGNHDLRFEYYENGGDAMAGLSWAPIVGSTAPTISSISPSALAANAGAQNVTVNGSKFQQGLAVGVFFPNNSGSTPNTTLSGSQIINVTATSFTMRITLSSAGTWGIRVNNPDGQRSSRFNFSVGSGGACVASVASNRWKGEYFNNRTLSGSPAVVRDDGTGAINFDWGGDSPGSACGVGVDNFSARWTRTVNFAAGTYRFTVTGDDGIRLYVDGQLMLDKWLDQAPTTYMVDMPLSAGNHDLKLEFYENGGGAVARLNFNAASNGDCITTVPSNNWRGEYFNNRTLSGSPAVVRDDGTGFIDFDWGGDSPGSACGIGVNNFSARWTRTVNFAAGTYRFTVTGDDGIRLYVDGQLMLDKWFDQAPTTYTVGAPLTAGDHDLRFEYYENGGGAVARLSWALVYNATLAPTLLSIPKTNER
jgi:subtilisin-like proprotein convertase family protein